MIDLLKKLLAPPGVTGDEKSAADAASLLLEPWGAISRTPLGSVICRMPTLREGLPRVLLTAHLDQIGLMGICVTEEGFLKAAPCGGVDRRSLAGARVTVHTKAGELAGVVCSVPPHLSNEKATPLKPEDIFIDIGLNKKDAEAVFSPGDRITFACPPLSLACGRFCSAGLDNRAGCAAVVMAAQLLSNFDGVEIVVALTTREETGSAGALTAAFSLMPDVAFAVDMSMGATPDDRIEHCGVLGCGPMVGISPALSRRLSNFLIETAKQENIPHQVEVMAGRTGTDADVIVSSCEGIPTALLSIPLRYMHTPSEVVVLSDIEQTARLLAAGVRGVIHA
jgi:endoglucanase